MKEQMLRRAIGEQQTDKPYGGGRTYVQNEAWLLLSGTLGNWRSGSGQKKKLTIEETDSLVEYLQISLQEIRVPAWKKKVIEKPGMFCGPWRRNWQLKKRTKNPYQKITIQETGSPVEYLKLLSQEMLWGSKRKRSNEEAGFGNKKILTRNNNWRNGLSGKYLQLLLQEMFGVLSIGHN